jgi:hypothetical protein
MFAVGLLDHARWQQLTEGVRKQRTQNRLIPENVIGFSFHVAIIGKLALIIGHRLEGMHTITVRRREGNKENECKLRDDEGEGGMEEDWMMEETKEER